MRSFLYRYKWINAFLASVAVLGPLLVLEMQNNPIFHERPALVASLALLVGLFTRFYKEYGEPLN